MRNNTQIQRGDMNAIYPMLFQPVLKDYIWGGHNLEKYGRVFPDHRPVAESWEISSHPDGMTPIMNGIYAGKNLQEILEILGEDLVGWNNQWALERNKFPWMVKLIDADQNLSVQVHPDDAYAQQNEGNELGKYEMWVVLETNKPETSLIFGLKETISRDKLEQAIMDGHLEKYLHRLPIQKGDHICVPARSLHAILAGTMIVEIQQNSNTTYRVYDWNRVDTGGKPRTLHVEKALDVVNLDLVNSVLPKPMILYEEKDLVCEQLCQNAYFTTERYHVKSPVRLTKMCDGSSLEIWGVIKGEAEIAGQLLTGIQFVLLPAKLGAFDVVVPEGAILLRTYQPGNRI